MHHNIPEGMAFTPIEPKNERYENVEQALELIALLPKDSPLRTQLAIQAAKVWMFKANYMAMFAVETKE